MILRRFMQHITEQNWFAVGLDVIVVVFGVYLGLLIGDQANEREIDADVLEALSVVVTSLEEDLVHMEAVIESKNLAYEAFSAKLAALDPDKLDVTLVAKYSTDFGKYMRTFYPNRSAYRTMRDRGYLVKVKDPELKNKLIDFYEREYDRLDANTQTHEAALTHYLWEVRPKHWDIVTNTLLLEDRTSIIQFRNSLHQLKDHASYYRGRLARRIRPQIEAHIKAINAYIDARK